MNQSALRSRVFLLSGLLLLCGGRVTPAGAFTTVINVPPDTVPDQVLSDSQLNLLSGGLLDKGVTLGGPGVLSANIEANLLGGSLTGSLVGFSGSTININTDLGVGGIIQVAEGGILNIDSGDILSHFDAFADSTTHVTGGTVRTGVFQAFEGSTINISGGFMEGVTFQPFAGATVNLSGGVIGNDFNAFNGATLNVTGGRIGRAFDAFKGSKVTIFGGDFMADGQPIEGLENPGDSVSLPGLSLLSGTLSDGTVFIYSTVAQDNFDPGVVTLQAGTAPTVVPGVINAPLDVVPKGVRAGQTLNLGQGADVGDHFASVGGELNVTGGSVGFGLEIVDTRMTLADGSVGDSLTVYQGSTLDIVGGSLGDQGRALAGGTVNLVSGSIGGTFGVVGGGTLNIRGGTVGANVSALSGGTINVSGGNVPDTLRMFGNSVLNVLGLSFFVTDPNTPGELIDLTLGRTPGESMLVTGRVGVLTGTLADGSPFTFNLASFISSQATLTITLALPGDLDGDGFVGISDLNVVLGAWNQTVTPGDRLLGDPSGDGFVGIEDLNEVLGNWNAGTPPGAPPRTAVPEPAAVGVIGVGVLGTLNRKRCRARQ